MFNRNNNNKKIDSFADANAVFSFPKKIINLKMLLFSFCDRIYTLKKQSYFATIWTRLGLDCGTIIVHINGIGNKISLYSLT